VVDRAADPRQPEAKMKKALILVDIQNDFLPGGALAVPEGDAVVEHANRLQERFELVVATQDWHPPDHGSFASNNPGYKPGERIQLDGLDQILWPDHCVQGTRGAEFAPRLRTKKIARVFRKGTDPRVDSYSGFHDNGGRGDTGLGDYLRAEGVWEVWICGLATDYCVKFTALDARREGFEAKLAIDACRGVGLAPGDIDHALKLMRDAGVEIVRGDDGPAA
jgi:nicotinamidase/pyrazinamidase